MLYLTKYRIKFASLTNFESSLLIVLKRFGQENLFLNNQEKNEWTNLSMKQKIDIIWMICELRIQLNDVEAKFNVSFCGFLKRFCELFGLF